MIGGYILLSLNLGMLPSNNNISQGNQFCKFSISKAIFKGFKKVKILVLHWFPLAWYVYHGIQSMNRYYSVHELGWILCIL